jgi:hypothetical protein
MAARGVSVHNEGHIHWKLTLAEVFWKEWAKGSGSKSSRAAANIR